MALALGAIPVGGAASLAIMALGYYGRLQGVTAAVGAVDQTLITKYGQRTALEEKHSSLEIASSGKLKRKNKSDQQQPGSELEACKKDLETVNKEIAGIEVGRQVVIRRGFRLRKMMVFLLIAIALAVVAGLWATLTTNWVGFHWFAVICMLAAFIFTMLSVVFAALELREGVSSEEREHLRVLRLEPAWKGPTDVLELLLNPLGTSQSGKN